MQFLKDTKINFLNKRKPAFIISGIFLLLSIGFLFINNPKWGIDFTGGELLHLQFDQPPSVGELRSILDAGGIPDSSIQRFPASGVIIIRMSGEGATGEMVQQAIIKGLPDSKFEILRSEMVGPAVGVFIKERAVKAFIFAFIGMIIYVSWRFKGGVWGLAAVIALVHDVIITFGVLNFAGITIDLPVMAALLTLAGYSINDSIVVYDRIRENIRLHYKMPLKEVINHSINETLSRTVITSGTTFFVVLALFFLGGEVLHGFAVALLAGILVGTYSSIFIASPLIYIWMRRGSSKK